MLQVCNGDYSPWFQQPFHFLPIRNVRLLFQFQVRNHLSSRILLKSSREEILHNSNLYLFPYFLYNYIYLYLYFIVYYLCVFIAFGFPRLFFPHKNVYVKSLWEKKKIASKIVMFFLHFCESLAHVCVSWLCEGVGHLA